MEAEGNQWFASIANEIEAPIYLRACRQSSYYMSKTRCFDRAMMWGLSLFSNVQ